MWNRLLTSLNPQLVEGSAVTAQVATVFDTGPSPTFTVSINQGDGTTLDTTTGTVTPITGSPGAFTVFGTHTYNEESSSVTPAFNFSVTVTVHDTANNLNTVVNFQTSVLDANLSQGNPVSEASSQTFSATGAGSTAAALASFEAAIPGVKNTAAAPQANGFRTITWDGVKTDGTDAAPASLAWCRWWYRPGRARRCGARWARPYSAACSASLCSASS